MVIFEREIVTPRVRSLLIFVFLLVTTASVLFGQSAVEDKLAELGFAIAAERSEAPDFTLEDLDGRESSLSSYRGKVVFLNFWATWCGPCRAEMPSMERLYAELPRDRFEILAVDMREFRGKVAEFVDELDLTFPVLLDERGVTGAMYGIRGIPTTYLVDKEGNLVARLVGSRQWDTAEVQEAIRHLIDE